MKPFAFAITALGLALATSASAHTLLVNPTPLTSDDNAKSGPCGCYFGSPEDPNEDGTPSECPPAYPTTDLVAGQPLDVSWLETVNHNGAFRLAFSSKPVNAVTKADVAANILYDEVDMNDTAGATITGTITVPSTPCDNCTLQLRQDMGGTFYYSCAAIRIVEGGSGSGGAGATSASSGGSTTSTGSSGGASSTSTNAAATSGGNNDSTGPGMATPAPAADANGCSVGPAQSPLPRSLSAMALTLAGLVFGLRHGRRGRGRA